MGFKEGTINFGPSNPQEGLNKEKKQNPEDSQDAFNASVKEAKSLISSTDWNPKTKKRLDALQRVLQTKTENSVDASINTFIGTQTASEEVVTGLDIDAEELNKPFLITSEVAAIRRELNMFPDGVINVFQLKNLRVKENLTSMMSQIGAKGILQKSGNFLYMDVNGDKKGFNLVTGTFI